MALNKEQEFMVCRIPEDWEFPAVIFSRFQSNPETQISKKKNE